MSKTLSIIITASYIKSHPSIEFVKCVIESLRFINMKTNTPIILAHDFSENELYKKYLKALYNYISDKPNIKIVVRDSHGHLTGNVRNAFNFINTDYVLIIQHDFPFIKNFQIEKIIEDMEHNPELKHIRFNKRANVKLLSDSLNDLFGKQIESINYTYTRTPSWSDNNHLCRSSYYREIILKECNDGRPMELYLITKSKTEEIHKKYGTYIFGKNNESAYIKHIDGKNNNNVIL